MGIFSFLFPKNDFDLKGPDFKAQFQAAKDAVLLDVRTKGEFNGGHLNGAKNIDFMAASFKNEIKKLSAEKTYYLYCRSGNRSSQACKIMKASGLKVYNLQGGIGAWPK